MSHWADVSVARCLVCERDCSRLQNCHFLIGGHHNGTPSVVQRQNIGLHDMNLHQDRK